MHDFVGLAGYGVALDARGLSIPCNPAGTTAKHELDSLCIVPTVSETPDDQHLDCCCCVVVLMLQRVMQNDAAVFRTGETLQEGCQKIDDTVASFNDVKVGGE